MTKIETLTRPRQGASTLSLKGEGNPQLNIKPDFPALAGRDIAFLDSAASAQKPQCVIDTMTHVMSDHYANIHRGLYDFSQKTTSEYEAVRGTIRAFINAPSVNEVIFTRNTTEGLNLIAQSWGRTNLKAGDEVIISAMEHHANIVPWQLLRDQMGIELKIIPILENGTLDYDAFEAMLSPRTRLVSLVHICNATGVINDVKRVMQTAKSYQDNIICVIDGSQSVVHGHTDIQDVGCDFFVFTGHKLYGPSGVGVLWGREDILNAMPPYQGGGDMIETVTFDKTTYRDAPARFEAGTPSIVDVIGLGAAVDYVSAIGMDKIATHEAEIYAAARDNLPDGFTLYGDVDGKAPIISFNMDGAHHSDIAMILNQAGVAVRTGHHCCMPLMQAWGVDGTARASFAAYNDMADVERFLTGLDKVRKLLG